MEALKKLSNRLPVAMRKTDGEKKGRKTSGTTYIRRFAIFILSNKFETIAMGCEIIYNRI
ncbi:hypothetical protein BPIT_29540 [Candidatus Brocadia pituitae]|nr:hypothetical protein BPIT_29540 [Candidatus Brocadia pituitae]